MRPNSALQRRDPCRVRIELKVVLREGFRGQLRVTRRVGTRPRSDLERPDESQKLYRCAYALSYHLVLVTKYRKR